MKKRLWIFQNNLSGNSNGHFSFIELPVNSTKKDVKKSCEWWAYKCFNIQDLGIFKSKIGNVNFCPKSTGKTNKKKK